MFKVVGRLLASAFVVLLVPAATAANPIYNAPQKSVHATVRVLALSSSVHSAFSGSQDTYIAAIQRGSEIEVVKLLDRYPPYALPIRREIWKRAVLRVLLTRDSSCDLQQGISALPIHEQSTSQPELDQHLTEAMNTAATCFVLNHNTVRLAG